MNDRLVHSALFAILLIGGAWLAQAHAYVTDKVERITVDMQALKAASQGDHDRQVRTEAQLEYLAKLALISINDRRQVAGLPLVADEFPREGSE